MKIIKTVVISRCLEGRAPDEKVLLHVDNNGYFNTIAVWRVKSEKPKHIG